MSYQKRIEFWFSDGEEREPLVIPKEDRELVTYEGWDQYLSNKRLKSRLPG